MSRFSLAPFWRYPRLVCFLSSVLLLLASCGQNATAGQTSAQVGRISAQSCDIEVSWAVGYGSLKELKRAEGLDLAVQGTFIKILNTQGQFSLANGQNGPLTTAFSFVISKVLLDPHHLLKSISASIAINQMGGWQGNKLHQICDYPLFSLGEEVILFLHQSSSDQYSAIGGPSGRFEVRKGLVQPVNGEGVKLPPGLTEQQFYTLLQKA